MANNLNSNVTRKVARVFLEAFESSRVVTKTVDTQLLSGKFNRQSIFEGDDHRRFNLDSEKLESYLTKMESMGDLYSRYSDWSPAQIALRYGVSHPACHVSIPGGKTPEQVIENCRASDMPEVKLK